MVRGVDDLRTRIMEILQGESLDYAEDINVYAMADAVIRELRLQRESPQLCDGGSDRHRWVTDWTADE